LHLQYFLYEKIFFIACPAKFFPAKRNMTREDTEQKIKKDAMLNNLYSAVQFDSSKVKYSVLQVIFYDDVVFNQYDCEFKVHMIKPPLDTIGTMKAYISRDFQTVRRVY